MSNRLTLGFEKADSNNLPEATSEMISDFFANNMKFISAEVRHEKTKNAAKESYGDNAICYVELKRQGAFCTVQGKITPEHKIKKKPYLIKVVIDEKEQTIVSADCLDWVAAQGGCKHCIAFSFWIHRRSEEPSVTSTKCYWQGSKLAKADIVDDDIATILGKPIVLKKPDLEYVQSVVDSVPEKKGIIFQFYEQPKNQGSMHSLWTTFLKSDVDKTVENFLQFGESLLDDNLINTIEKNSRGQADNPMWFEMRFARITASIVYEAARSKTLEGTLRERILGAQTPIETEAIARGKNLEPQVLQVVGRLKTLKICKAGLFLNKTYPIFGASPDGITEEYVIEVKCPFSYKSIRRYVEDDVIAKKFYFQVQLQMFFSGRKKGLFCVASPEFETNEEVQIIEVTFNENEIVEILDLAKEFWIKAIYPQLVIIYSNVFLNRSTATNSGIIKNFLCNKLEQGFQVDVIYNDLALPRYSIQLITISLFLKLRHLM